MKIRVLFNIVIRVYFVILMLCTAAAQAQNAQAQELSTQSTRYDIEANYALGSKLEFGNYPNHFSNLMFNVYLPIIQLPPCAYPPTLVSPADNSVLDTIRPTFNLIKNNGPVSGTQISIADNPEFNSAENYYSASGSDTITLRIFENLNPGDEYYWRARDYCGALYGPFSATYQFTTGSGGVILPAPTLISPTNGTIGAGSEITATWTSVPGAEGYQVWRNILNAGGNLYFVSNNSIVFLNLQPNTTYEWHVDAYNEYAYGEDSEVWQFTTGSFTSAGDNETQFLPLQIPESAQHIILNTEDKTYTSK